MSNKKKVFVVAVAVCLIAILSMSSLAWFSDADEVTNKFMVSTSDDEDNPDDIFSVDIWENVDTDGDGVNEQVSIGDDVNGGVYKHIYPSQTLVKEPHVENTGAYDQWIRVKVTVTMAREWNQICTDLADPAGEPYELATIFKGHDETLWTVGEKVYDDANNTLTYTYYLNEKLEPATNEILFEEIVLPYQLTQAQMATLNGGFELKMVAEAIQADNTGDNAFDAFTLVEQTQPFN